MRTWLTIPPNIKKKMNYLPVKHWTRAESNRPASSWPERCFNEGVVYSFLHHFFFGNENGQLTFPYQWHSLSQSQCRNGVQRLVDVYKQHKSIDCWVTGDGDVWLIAWFSNWFATSFGVRRNEPPAGLNLGNLPHHRIQVSPVRDEIVN